MALAELSRTGTEPWRRLAEAAGGACAVFGASDAELRATGLGDGGISRLRTFDGWRRLGERRVRCNRDGIALTPFDANGYPRALREIHDPPLLLYSMGVEPARVAPAVAIVGSRKATRYGRAVAIALGRALARAGVWVLSGMARGIDGAAHRGALEEGASAAVMAGGLDRIYPRENRDLFRIMAERGCVLSEHPPGMPPLAHNFPVRNRIITGLAAATVVVEAGLRSGSLVSARLALDQGREVFAVPGNIDVETARGTNALIRDGCALLDDPADVLAMLALPVPQAAAQAGDHCRPAAGVTGDAAVVLGALETVPVHVDRIIEETRLQGARVLEVLTALELDGLAEHLEGGMYALSRT
jgi:DNA processing protein